jgi:L-proline amide hydrolase
MPSNDPEECGYIPVEGGRIWYRINGLKQRGASAIIAVAGGPGLSHHYLAPLLALSDERPVVLYDQLDTGNADRPGDPANWQLERFVTEIPALRRALGLDEVVVVGHSWGGTVALEYALSQPAGLRALVLASPVISMQRWCQDTAALVAELPQEARTIIADCSVRGDFDSDAFRQADEVYLRRHVLPVEPPEALSRSLALFNTSLYHAMWGPSEFTPTGTLRGYEAAERLPGLGLPVLFICGENDEARPASCSAFASMMPYARVVAISETSHCTLNEKPDEFLTEVRRFLAVVDDTPPGARQLA